MASITSTAFRQAGRLCRHTTGPGIPSRGISSLSRVATAPAQRLSPQRRYVSETKRDNAQVNVETAIKLDKKDFIDVVPQSPDASNVMVSPMAEVLKQVTTMEEGQRPIYLDMQATTPVDPRVLDAMLPFYTGIYGNPHSRTHAYGWESEEAVETARQHIAKLIGADSKEIIFTSGATESNNMSIKGVARFFGRSGKKRHIVTSQTEHKVRLDPIISGGGQERGLRSGTLAPPLVAGFGEACRIAYEEMEYDSKRIKALSDRLLNGLLSLEHTTQNGDPEHFYPGCVNVSFAYVEGESLLMALKDIALSSGSACTSASLEPSYVLRALGNSDESAHSSIRFGIGRFTTEQEIDYVLKAVKERVDFLRELSPLWELVQEGVDLNTIQWSQH
ncbi:cysteine desulfurase, mitochondrial [Colletotrichum liriopes]|uniref:Cysteine desulfurase, mitochondrial n=1 Tax=Colletotrichum liriopes TaxID=708192 RepID=A0AA37LPG0_9PEZI|nr:cysteine desulfurase, mitochondrial [Colletotrichum liriopes]